MATITYPNFTHILQAMPNGWCTELKAQHLFELAIQSGCELSVELGVYSGRSLIPIAMAHKDQEKGFALGIDSWSKKAALEGTNDQANFEWWEKLDFNAIYLECTNAIEQFDLLDHCGTVKLRSATFGHLLPNNSVTLLHQDSNHSEEITCEEVAIYTPKMKRGGIWVSDDSRWETVQRSLGMLINNGFDLIGEFENGDNFYKVFIKR